MTRIPIACTLTVTGAEDRVEEWRTFFARHVDAVDRETPTCVRLRLSAGAEPLVAAVDLAEREKQCCAFFLFSIVIDGHARWLRVDVPDDAEPILDDFAGLLPPHLARSGGSPR